VKITHLMNRIIVILTLLTILTESCNNKGLPQESSLNDLSGGRISVTDNRFVDSSGRQVMFNGINYVNKNRSENYIFPDSAAVFSKFSEWGFNCIRLGVIWDGVEPEPGKYNDSYLDEIENQVRKASGLGLYVLLDMHQDLYSVIFSDGAPEWATMTDGEPHFTGAIWSDSYFLSPAVQRAFDNFWANKPAPDGIGIQDHYANMWRFVAERFAGNNTVIGYDIMNEPFNGSQGTLILPVILKAYATILARETGQVLSEEDLLKTWGNEDSRMKALEWMSSVERYSNVIRSATELNQQFEKNVLGRMYQRVADRIREVDTTHILFLEHAYFSNAGVESGIEPVKDIYGNPDKLTAYAAHGYDLLVDTRFYDKSSDERIEYIFGQVKNVSNRINRPVILGEWGAFSGSSGQTALVAQKHRTIFDRHLFSQTYWAYHQNVDKDLYFHKTFKRPNAMFVNGSVKTINYDYNTGEFICTWEESPEIVSGTVFFVPDLENLDRSNIIVTPEKKNIVIQSMNTGKGGYIIVPASHKKIERKIHFSLTPDANSIRISVNDN
jgi:endoglycosylceramidase